MSKGKIIVGASPGIRDIPGFASWRRVGVRIVVVDGRYGIWLLGRRAARQVGTNPVGTLRLADVGLDEHIHPLADAQSDYLGIVGLDWHEVVGNYRHGMLVDGEALDALCAGVDQAEAVGFAGLEPELGDAGAVGAFGLVSSVHSGTVEVHLAVDQIVV